MQNATVDMVCAEFPAGVAPVITMMNRVATRNWDVSLGQPKHSGRREQAKAYLAARGTFLRMAS
jgi:hypothetical protein